MSCDTFIEALASEYSECNCEVLLLVCTLLFDVVKLGWRADRDLALLVSKKVNLFKEATLVTEHFSLRLQVSHYFHLLELRLSHRGRGGGRHYVRVFLMVRSFGDMQ